MRYFTHSMGSWVWSPQARRSMFMTIPEKYKLWSVVLWSKKFEKLVRIFFRKNIFFENFSLNFRTKIFFDQHFRERKNREMLIFSRFFLSKMWVEKIFLFGNSIKNFRRKYCFELFFGPTFRNFWNIAPSSKVYIFRGWSWTLTCELAGTQLNFPCCALNIPHLIE